MGMDDRSLALEMLEMAQGIFAFGGIGGWKEIQASLNNTSKNRVV